MHVVTNKILFCKQKEKNKNEGESWVSRGLKWKDGFGPSELIIITHSVGESLS